MGQPVIIDTACSNLKPGDLLFFGKSPDTITPVGMYPGEQKFIHSDGLVKINSFDPDDPEFSQYRDHDLRVVRRIL